MCECVRVCVKPRLEVRARLWGCACLQGESCSWACNAKRLQHGKALDTWCFYGQVFATTTTTTATKRHITVREECTNKNKTLAVHAMRARAGVEWLALRIRRVVSEGVSQAQRRWSNNQGLAHSTDSISICHSDLNINFQPGRVNSSGQVLSCSQRRLHLNSVIWQMQMWFEIRKSKIEARIIAQRSVVCQRAWGCN